MIVHVRTDVFTFTSPMRAAGGVLARNTSPHNPRRSTVPSTVFGVPVSVKACITAANGAALTYSDNRCRWPGRQADVMSTSPAGKYNSPTLTPSRYTAA